VLVRLACPSRLIPDRSRTGVHLALATIFFLLGSTSLQNAAADGDTRALSFQHTHRDDSITVTFKRNGRYDEDELKKLNYFLRDWRTDDQTRMDPQLFDVLWEIQREVGTKEPIHIVSSYRSPKTNAMLRRRSHGVAQFSQHMLGKAIDFFIPGVPLEQLRFAGLRLQRGGVGYYPTSGSPFVHVDVGGIRHWPRMTHDQLVRVFPDGKTVHVPSDGVPLKGYQLALAEVQRRGSTPSAMSLAAAHNAGIQTADAEGAKAPGMRSFLARLLKIGSDEEDEHEAAAPHDQQPAAPAAARQELATVPMPRSRPAQASEFTLASANASAPPTPADVINARGLWNAPAPSSDPKASAAALALSRAVEAGSRPAPPEAIGPNGERLAWVTGPQSQPLPRPPLDVEAVGTGGPPASLVAWASNPGQNERVATNVALAYAPATQPAPPTPMGSLRSANPTNTGNATIATKRPAANPPAAKIVPRSGDPWLRGIVMTPSVHHSLRVALLGAPDTRTLQPLMQKPGTTLAIVFSNDPLLGITSLQFSGPAVAFLPTITYPTRTAGLAPGIN